MKNKILVIIFMLIFCNILALPKPYLFYFEVPLGVHVIQPEGLFVKAFSTGYNTSTKQYLWICIYANTSENNELAFLYWLRALAENAPSEMNLIFEEVGNNTSSARYNFIKPILNNLGFNL